MILSECDRDHCPRGRLPPVCRALTFRDGRPAKLGPHHSLHTRHHLLGTLRGFTVDAQGFKGGGGGAQELLSATAEQACSTASNHNTSQRHRPTALHQTIESSQNSPADSTDRLVTNLRILRRDS